MDLQEILNKKAMILDKKNAILTKTYTNEKLDIEATFHFTPIEPLDYQAAVEKSLYNIDLEELVKLAEKDDEKIADAAIKLFELEDLEKIYDEILRKSLVANKKTRKRFTKKDFELFLETMPGSVRMGMASIIIKESGLSSDGGLDINS